MKNAVSLISNLPLPVVVVTKSGDVVETNRAFLELAARIPILVNHGVVEVEARSIGQVHTVLGEISPPLGLIPRGHLFNVTT